MQTIYLHREDLEDIKKFLDAFPDKEVVEVNADSSSGIGTYLTATISGVTVNDNVVSVSKVISDESSW